MTGETAEIVDYRELMESWLPIVFVFVLGLSFILLTVAFRSIVVAAKAIVMNLLSVGAAYGLIVLVFQEGVGNELFGFQQVDAIEAGCRSSSSPSSSASRWTTTSSCSAGSVSTTRQTGDNPRVGRVRRAATAGSSPAPP